MTILGDCAFRDNISLTSVSLPDELITIRNCAFQGCTGLSTLSIPDTVTSIGEYTFQNCTGLTYVYLGKCLNSLGYRAFRYCNNITTIVSPDALTSIGDYAFDYTNIRKVILPASVTSFNRTIRDLSSISIFESENTTNVGYYTVDGILFYYNEYTNDTTLVRCPVKKTVREYTVPENVTKIGSMAFSDNTSLSQITLPIGLKTISNSFCRCTGLKTISIPSTITNIGGDAFLSCSNLSSAFFYGDAPTVGYHAFEGTASITIYYIEGKSGWTTPTWNGYNTATFVPEEKTPVTGVSLSRASASLTVGDTLTLTATVSPADADDPSVTWSSSAPAVATVAGGVVTAKSAGRATITVTTKDGGFTAKCIVTVTDLVTDPVATITTVPASTKASLGGTVSYYVYISGTFDGFAFYLTAPDGMTVESVVPASQVGGSAISANHMADGRWLVSVMGNCKQTDAPDTLLATITLHVSADAAVGERTLSLEDIAVSDTKGDPVTAVKTVYGTLTVVDYVPGDVNGDDTFDYYDVTKLYACFCGKTTIDNGSIKDINGDGAFDYFDVAKLYAVYRGDAVMP